MTRISRRAADQIIQNRRTAPPDRPQRRGHRQPREPLWVKLDDHLPAPTDDFEADPFTPTTVTAKRLRRENNNSQDTHYTLDNTEDENGDGTYTIVNRCPWTWCYRDSIVLVERMQGEWVPVQPLFSRVLGRTSVAHNKGQTKDVNVYWGATKGSETIVTGETVSAYNRFADLGSNIWVWVIWLINGWELVNAEC